MTQLTQLLLGGNQLIGQIPYWLVNLTHLTSLSLRNNKFRGTKHFDLFLKLQNLTYLHLSDVHFERIQKNIEVEEFENIHYISDLMYRLQSL